MLVVLEKILGTAPEGPEPFAANAPGNGSSAYFQNFTCLVMWRPITIAKKKHCRIWRYRTTSVQLAAQILLSVPRAFKAIHRTCPTESQNLLAYILATNHNRKTETSPYMGKKCSVSRCSVTKVNTWNYTILICQDLRKIFSFLANF